MGRVDIARHPQRSFSGAPCLRCHGNPAPGRRTVGARRPTPLDLDQRVDRPSRRPQRLGTLTVVPSPRTLLRLSTAALLATLAAGATPAAAAPVRIFSSDGRQVDAVDARNAGDAVTAVKRIRDRHRAQPTTDPVTACAAEPTTQAFASLGDLADYSLAPAGDFEGRLDTWQLSDATPVFGNEDVGILPGSRSLLIGVREARDAAAYSPNICVDPSKPTFRFLFRAPRPGTSVITTLRFHPKDDPTLTVEIDSATNAADTDWTAAQPNALATKIAGQLMNDVGEVAIGFRPIDADGTTGRAQIDNLLIDPYRRG
jgi:hypothetical protein